MMLLPVTSSLASMHSVIPEKARSKGARFFLWPYKPVIADNSPKTVRPVAQVTHKTTVTVGRYILFLT
mgnify:CR=1 FL=1